METPPVAIAHSALLPAPEQRKLTKRPWLEIELLLLVLLVVGVYFTRLTALTIRGEESRWARVAQEMIETGDWIVPRQQGRPFPDRPPLNSWAMIGASKIVGELNLVAVRLPTVMATLLTTVLIYLYGRNFLTRLGAFAAAAAFPTMAQVMQLGRLAESDSLLTLCVAGALFCWHWAQARRSSAMLAWILGYALAAIAGLAKGPQGPIYFVGITTVYLCWRRDWKFLFSPWHLAGLAAFALVLGAWQLPFLRSLDAESVQRIWSEGGELGARFQYRGLGRALRHWLTYPLEVWTCMLPWSCMLFVLPTRWFRERIGQAGPMVAFLLTACAVTFPTCWLPADTRSRYFMSLYPCVALLIGLVIERCCQEAQDSLWQRSWNRFLRWAVPSVALAAVAVVAAAIVCRFYWTDIGRAMTPPIVVLHVTACVLAEVAIVWSIRNRDVRTTQAGVLGVASLLGLFYTGLVVSIQKEITNDPSSNVVAVRELLPPGEELVSYGPVHHLFAYYYQTPIGLEPLVDDEAPADSNAHYFCFSEDPGFPKTKIPFEWEEVAVISCDRTKSDRPLAKVIVGKRKWEAQNVSYIASDDEENSACPDDAQSSGAGSREPSARNLEPIREPSGRQSHFSPRAPQDRDSPRRFSDTFLE